MKIKKSIPVKIKKSSRSRILYYYLSGFQFKMELSNLKLSNVNVPNFTIFNHMYAAYGIPYTLL